MYAENRVRVKDYAPISMGDPRLVTVPGVRLEDNQAVRGRPRMLHWAAAQALGEMSRAAREDGLPEILIASGWRRHRWKSRDHYETVMKRRFGSVREGRKWVAYNSPHETGLAIDIGCGGLWPTKSTRKAQRETELHAWLVEHAHEYGFTPYKREPWHWEYRMDPELWKCSPPE